MIYACISLAALQVPDISQIPYPKRSAYPNGLLDAPGTTIPSRFDAASSFGSTRITYFSLGHERPLQPINGIGKFYPSWHTVESGKGYDAKAAEWRGKLEELQAQQSTGKN